MHPSLAALLLTGTCFAATACSGETEPVEPAAVASAPAPSASASVHALRCGCDIESIGACGEYIEVAGELVPLALPLDLGPMPFCGKSGLQAKVDGELVDGVFVARTFAYVD